MDALIHGVHDGASDWHSIRKLCKRLQFIFPTLTVQVDHFAIAALQDHDLESYRHIKLKFGQSMHLA